MFKVLYAPYESVQFERFQPRSRSKAVLAYESHKGCRVLISTVRLGDESAMMEYAADFLNSVQDLEFSRPMLRSIQDVWKSWKREHESSLMRTLRYESMFQTRDRQPPFAPNNGERPDGIW